MSEIKLLPCPFCGGEAKLSKSGSYAVVSCLKSSCNGNACCYKYDSPEEAVEHWNERKPAEHYVATLEEELKLSETEKERCIRENMLQFDSAKGYATGIHNALEMFKEECGIK